MSVSSATASTVGNDPRESRPLLSVVVPVFNGGAELVENLGVIRTRAAGMLATEDVELVVVSDGSLDDTAERLVALREAGTRVIHYDRNLGKGYAVKAGALAAHGEWIAIVDADLDLDPGAIPSYLELARREGLDFAIGSKRHPDSVVHYPRSRRTASWCYQQLNRLLFRLDVRDTQVGLKVMNRRVAEEVVPLLLVKQFAFDLELLAVARSLGFRRVRELPVRLEYRFTGSGVRSAAVARALWDTAAVFYRLRVLRTYQRKRRLIATSAAGAELPRVTLVGDLDAARLLDYPRLDTVAAGSDEIPRAGSDLVAVLTPGARPAGNWLSATVPYFVRADVAAVVVPTLSPLDVPLRTRAAAAVLESRLGGGSRRLRYLPGNVREVVDYPARSCVARRADLVLAREAGVDGEQLVSWLARRGRRTVYTPDTSLAEAPAPLLLPHLRGTLEHARARGAAARETGGRSLSGATSLALAPVGCAALGLALVASGDARRASGTALALAYAAAVAGSALLAGLRFRSASVALVAAPALLGTQAAYVTGFLHGLVRGR